MTATKLTWTKTGGHNQSSSITYTADFGGFEIIRTRICGEWGMYGLYRDGVFVRGYKTIADAKLDAADMASYISEGRS
jgi:hypothetical protein